MFVIHELQMKETGVSHYQYSDAHDFFKILHNHKFECTLSNLAL